QKADMSSTSIKQQVLSLNFTNNRQHLAATVGQQIEITLGTVGPKQYGTPQFFPLQSNLRASRWHGRRIRAARHMSTFSRRLPKERCRSKFLLSVQKIQIARNDLLLQ